MVKLSLLIKLPLLIAISNISCASAWVLKEKQQQIITETSLEQMSYDDDYVKQDRLKIHYEYGLNNDNTLGFIFENELKFSLQKMIKTSSPTAKTDHIIIARSTKFAPLKHQYFIRHLLWENHQQVLSIQAGINHYQAANRQLNLYSNYVLQATDPNLMDPEPIILNNSAPTSRSRSFNSYQLTILFGNNFNVFGKDGFYNFEASISQVPQEFRKRKTLYKFNFDNGIHFKKDRFLLTQFESSFIDGKKATHSISGSIVQSFSPNISFQIGSSFNINHYRKNTYFIGLWLYF